MAGDHVNPRSGSTVVSVGDEIVLLGGVGYSRDQEFSAVEALNVRTGTWRTLPSLNISRSGTQAIFYDEKIWIVSGEADAGEKVENLEVVSWKELVKES